MSWAIALTRTETAKTINFDGATKTADLIFESVESNDLSELDFDGVVRWDEGVFDLFDFVFFD